VSNWFKSSASNGKGNCVEVELGADHVGVRNSRDPYGAFLVFTHEEWQAFLIGAKAGEFEVPRSDVG
jgi:hypothetical protein